MLSIGKYRKLKIGTRSGVAANFKLRNPEEGVIYQKVNLTYKTADEEKPDRWLYTEAWLVDPTRKKAIDQGGRDAFLVDTDDIEKHGGTIRFKTTAWFEAGEVDESMKEGEGPELWGSLLGKYGHRAVPAGARVVKRTVVATWKKNGKLQWKTRG